MALYSSNAGVTYLRRLLGNQVFVNVLESEVCNLHSSLLGRLTPYESYTHVIGKGTLLRLT